MSLTFLSYSQSRVESKSIALVLIKTKRKLISYIYQLITTIENRSPVECKPDDEKSLNKRRVNEMKRKAMNLSV